MSSGSERERAVELAKRIDDSAWEGAIHSVDEIQNMARALLAAVEERDVYPQSGDRHKWCRYSGPGRGDCEHFVGIPAEMNQETCDEYGIPHGWCDWCWRTYEYATLQSRAAEERRDLGVAVDTFENNWKDAESRAARAEEKLATTGVALSNAVAALEQYDHGHHHQSFIAACRDILKS